MTYNQKLFTLTRTLICENLLTSIYQFCILKAQFNTNNFVARKRSNLYWLPKHRMKIRTEAICTYFSGVFLFVLSDTDGKSPFLCSSEVRTFLFLCTLTIEWPSESDTTLWWYEQGNAAVWFRGRNYFRWNGTKFAEKYWQKNKCSL